MRERIEVHGMYATEEYERIAQLARIGFSAKNSRMIHEYRNAPEDAELHEDMFRDLAALQSFDSLVYGVKERVKEALGGTANGKPV